MNRFRSELKLCSGIRKWTRTSTVLVALALISTFIALRPAEPASADLSIAQDDFEDYWNGPTGYGWLDSWDFNGNAGPTVSSDPNDGWAHLRLRGNGASAVRTAEVTGESSLRLRVWVRSGSLMGNQDAVLEVSDDGSNYVELDSWGRNDARNYAFYDFDLSSTGLTFESQVWIQVRITGNPPEAGDFYLDDIGLVNSGENPDPVPDPGISQIELDGEFGDWDGQAMLADPADDQSGVVWNDIAALYWANNIDEGVNYHMIERHTANGQPYNGGNGQAFWARYQLFIDTNNNGSYTDNDDRRAVIMYVPLNNSGLTNVKLYPANSNSKLYDSGWNDWGETWSDGGRKVEFALDWDDLGISFGGVIRMYATSFHGLSSSSSVADRVPDGNADIQWSPASVLGMWVLAAAGVGGAVFIWFLSKRRRLWT